MEVWIAVHDLSRSGVPISLARLLRWLPAEQRRSTHLIAIHGGAMEAEMRGLVETMTLLEPDNRRSFAGAVAVASRAIGADSKALSVMRMRAVGTGVERFAWKLRLRTLPAPDVLVVHGAGAWDVAGVVDEKTPVALHLHELWTALNRCIDPSRQRLAFERANRIFAVCEPVAEIAVAQGVDRGSIELIPGPVDATTEPLAVAHGLADVASVVGIGTPSWRKGTDRLTPLAFELGRRVPNCNVTWIGGSPAGRRAAWVEADDPVQWMPEVPDPWSRVPHGSVLVIPSREDPLPLVALEAGLRHIGVVASPTGALSELLSEGRGVVAAGQSLEALCDAVEEAVADRAAAAAMGEKLADHVRAEFLVDVVAPRWWASIERVADEHA